MGGLSNSNENGDMDLTRSNLLEDKTVSENPSTSEKSDSDWSWNSWFSDDENDNQKNVENNDSTVSEEGNKHQNWTYEAAKADKEEAATYQKYHANLSGEEPQTKKYASTEDFVRDYKDKWQLKRQSLLEREEQISLQKRRANENRQQQEKAYQQLEDDKTFARRKAEERSFIKQRLKEQNNPYEKQAVRPSKMEEEMAHRLSPADTFVEDFHKNYNLKRQNLLKRDLKYTSFRGKHPLGSLSSEYESRGKSDTIGYDEGGGYSYGLYQIETKKGTMKSYLNYLSKHPDYHLLGERLIKAGGHEAAKSKHESFVREWKNLSQEDMFKKSQIDFIKQGHLKPLLNNLKTIKGLDINNLNPVLEDVLFSTAVQHTKASDIVKSALVSDKPVLTEDEIINKIYERRSSYVNERKELESKTKQAITQKRYPKERDKAQQWLRELSY